MFDWPKCILCDRPIDCAELPDLSCDSTCEYDAVDGCGEFQCQCTSIAFTKYIVEMKTRLIEADYNIMQLTKQLKEAYEVQRTKEDRG